MRILVAALLLGLAPAGTAAEAPPPAAGPAVTLDRIAAVVGEEVVLEGEISRLAAIGFLPRRRFAILPVPPALAPIYTGGRGGLEDDHWLGGTSRATHDRHGNAVRIDGHRVVREGVCVGRLREIARPLGQHLAE